MRVATFNANSIRVRAGAVIDWVRAYQPDVLCLQETKCSDADFPGLALASTEYHTRFRGMKGYNGVAVMSRIRPELVSFGFHDGIDGQDEARLVRVVIDGIPIINTYVPNGFKISAPQYAYKLRWFDRLRRYFETYLSPERPALWCGDMNVAPEPIDVHSPGKAPQACVLPRGCPPGLPEDGGLGIPGCLSSAPSRPSAVHVLGLRPVQFPRKEQGMADRSHSGHRAGGLPVQPGWRSTSNPAARPGLRTTRLCGLISKSRPRAPSGCFMRSGVQTAAPTGASQRHPDRLRSHSVPGIVLE